MEIILKPKAGGACFKFPALPEKIDVKTGASYQTFNILSKGQIRIPKGRENKQVSWSHVFFGKTKKKEAIVQTENWKSPKACIKQLTAWEKDGEELNLIVSGTYINIDVTIATFNYAPFGAYGNYSYSIVFEEARPLKVYTTKEKKVGGGKKKMKSRPKKQNGSKSNQNGKIYTVVPGDTLCGIAKRFLGGGENWTKLYDRNKKAIEADAKKHGKASSDHGHWIWPGLRLILP